MKLGAIKGRLSGHVRGVRAQGSEAKSHQPVPCRRYGSHNTLGMGAGGLTTLYEIFLDCKIEIVIAVAFMW